MAKPNTTLFGVIILGIIGITAYVANAKTNAVDYLKVNFDTYFKPTFNLLSGLVMDFNLIVENPTNESFQLDRFAGKVFLGNKELATITNQYNQKSPILPSQKTTVPAQARVGLTTLYSFFGADILDSLKSKTILVKGILYTGSIQIPVEKTFTFS